MAGRCIRSIGIRLMWSPPPPNWYKVNVDGAVFKEQGSIGVGVVIRNVQEEVMGAMSKKICLPLGAIEAKAKAMEEGILLAWDLGLKNIVIKETSPRPARCA